MANIILHTAIATNVERGSQLARRLISLSLQLFIPLCGLILVLLIPIILYQISREQEDLDSKDLPPETSEDQDSEPAAAPPALDRPTLQRRESFILKRNRSTSQPPSPGSLPVSSSLSSTKAYMMALSQAMAGPGAFAHPEDSVSSQTGAPTSSPAALIIKQTKDDVNTSTCDEEDAEKVKRRNIKMREEGVRVNVKYSQLAVPTWKPTSAPRSEPTQGTTASSPGSPSPGALQTPSSPSSSPSSASSSSHFLSGLQSPAPTPASDTVMTTPDLQRRQASILPPGGTAGGILDTLDEKLLAVPADAVSRRLLRDGRAVLHGRRRTPRSTSFVRGGESGQLSSSVEGEVQSSKSRVGYPSELME